jgi:CRISPR type III-A-associated RAMP protein Csm4
MEGLLFATARTRFADDAGVAVLVDPGDAVTERRLDILLDLLGHVGIGGDRSCGVGHFCIEEKTIAAVPDLGRGGRLLLSLAAPERSAVEGGLLNAPAVYTLIERGGWVTRPGASSLRRRSVRMIGEGSLVCDVGGAFGRAVRVLDAMPELRLPHPIWRGGREVALAAGLPA